MYDCCVFFFFFFFWVFCLLLWLASNLARIGEGYLNCLKSAIRSLCRTRPNRNWPLLRLAASQLATYKLVEVALSFWQLLAFVCQLRLSSDFCMRWLAVYLTQYRNTTFTIFLHCDVFTFQQRKVLWQLIRLVPWKKEKGNYCEPAQALAWAVKSISFVVYLISWWYSAATNRH
jgi:hypothetical protein